MSLCHFALTSVNFQLLVLNSNESPSHLLTYTLSLALPTLSPKHKHTIVARALRLIGFSLSLSLPLSSPNGTSYVESPSRLLCVFAYVRALQRVGCTLPFLCAERELTDYLANNRTTTTETSCQCRHVWFTSSLRARNECAINNWVFHWTSALIFASKQARKKLATQLASSRQHYYPRSEENWEAISLLSRQLRGRNREKRERDKKQVAAIDDNHGERVGSRSFASSSHKRVGINHQLVGRE